MLFVMTFVVCHDVILLYTLWFEEKKISLLDYNLMPKFMWIVFISAYFSVRKGTNE